MTAIGGVLGGNVGPGTLAFALLIGPLVGFTLPLFHVPGGEPFPRALPLSRAARVLAVTRR